MYTYVNIILLKLNCLCFSKKTLILNCSYINVHTSVFTTTPTLPLTRNRVCLIRCSKHLRVNRSSLLYPLTPYHFVRIGQFPPLQCSFLRESSLKKGHCFPVGFLGTVFRGLLGTVFGGPLGTVFGGVLARFLHGTVFGGVLARFLHGTVFGGVLARFLPDFVALLP